MSTVTAALFTWPLGDDVALIPRTAALADAHFALVQANYQRLARWFPDAFQEPPTRDGVRANLERAGRAWLDGSELPLSIAVKVEGGWRLVGWANLVIDAPARSAEVGYWLDAGFEGRGLVTRTLTALLDHAFGPLGLARVGLQTTADNTRSRSVAERLGFTQEGILREYAAFPEERRDLVVYSLLAREWHTAT
ncbi:GNAT family N-acetyltransferase [Micromonospora sp. NPDC003776]